MHTNHFSPVEKAFHALSGIEKQTTRMPYIVVDNFPKLGFLTALRFLEWVAENPTGVISLPTGKTPEFFIKWTQYLLSNWGSRKGEEILRKYNIQDLKKPDLRGLQFVQIDEFYPISSSQHNSFYNYVNEYYIKGFGLEYKKALLINSDTIPLPGNRHFTEVFPDSRVDLSLRYREASRLRAASAAGHIRHRRLVHNLRGEDQGEGGIGFFLGALAPMAISPSTPGGRTTTQQRV
jgi:glucosamine-6-phosphate deaminase